MKKQTKRIIIEGYEDHEVANIIDALSSIGRAPPQVFTKAQHKSVRNADHVGVNKRGEMKAVIHRQPGITVDDASGGLHVKFPQVSITEWKEVITKMTNPNYDGYFASREKVNKRFPGWDRLWPAE